MNDNKEVNPISEYLDSIGVGYRVRDGGTFDYKNITFGYTGKNTSIDCSIDFGKGGKTFTIFGMVPNRVPKD